MSNDTPIISHIEKKEKEKKRHENATTQNSASIGTIAQIVLPKLQKQRKSNTLFL
jgi:hypothetical protein